MQQQQQVRKTPLFEPFIYKNDLFTKTGSGQTWGKLQTSPFCRTLRIADGPGCRS
jgi:hypothetical protein